jgi:ABC-type glycerol-3-phosphate transport system substrate-binding protein
VTAVEPSPTVTLSPKELAAGQRITFWHAYSTHAVPVIDQLTAEFNQTNEYGITVDARGFLTDDQLRAAILASEPENYPQLILADSSQILALAEQQALVDLSPYLLAGTAVQANPDITQASQNLTLAGKLFAVPALREGVFLLYNNSWARELGFTAAPASLEEWELQSGAAFNANIFLPNKAARGTGGWLFTSDPETFLSWMGSPAQSAAWDFLNDDEFIQTLTRLKSWQENGLTWSGKNTDPAGYFVNRQALFVTVPSREMPEFLSHLVALNMPDEWSIIPFPLPAGRVPIGNDYGYAITQQSANSQMAAWLFTAWLLDPQRQAALADAEFAVPLLPEAQAVWLGRAGYPRLAEGAAQALPGSGEFPMGSRWPILRQILRDAVIQAMLPQTTVENLPGIRDIMTQLYQEYGN